MKKEKTIKTYQRRTKSGKMVTVKQHTAKYDAAEKAREMAKKKGAGSELEELKKKGKAPVQLEIDFDKEDNKEKDKAIVEEIKKSVKKETEKNSKSNKKEAPKKTEKKVSAKESKATKDGDFQVKESALKRLDREIKRLENPGKIWGPISRVKEERKSQREDLRRYKKAKDYLENGDRLKAAKLLVTNIDNEHGKFKPSEFYSKAEVTTLRDKAAKKQAKKEQSAYNAKLERAKAFIAEHEKTSSKNLSFESLKTKGYIPFKSYGTTLYIGKRGKPVYMKTTKGIIKADRDDYEDFVTGHNGLSKSVRKKLESLGWHEHEEY